MEDSKKINLLVSIIIPNWNGREFLKTCLDSISVQDYENFEVIVIDCASSDRSAGFVKKNYPKVRLIELKEDKGPTNALNIGIKESKGNYILLLNNDVILSSNCLATLVLELQQDENSAISPVELDWNKKFGGGGAIFSPGRILKFLSPFVKSSEIAPFWPPTACCICTKQTLLDNPLNEHFFMYEDFEWGWRLHLKKTKIKICFSTAFLHKGGAATEKASPKQTFLDGRALISSCFICLKMPTFFLLLPLILLQYLENSLFYIEQFKWRALLAYWRGFLDFLLRIKIFIKDRKKVQKERIISDWEVIKIMINGIKFRKFAREKWYQQDKSFLQNIA